MSQEDVADEMLMALADGELDREAAAVLRARIAADRTLAERYAAFADSRAGIQAALRPVAEAPVPDRLIASIRDFGAGEDSPAGNVTPFRRRLPGYVPMSLAASLLLAVLIGGVGGYALRGAGDAPLSAGPAIPQRALIAALTTAPAEQPRMWRAGGDSGAVTMFSTFRLQDGALCRQFQVTGSDTQSRGLACGETGEWRIVTIDVEPIAEDGAYTPASGAGAVGAYVDAHGGERLSAEEEAALIQSNWRE